MDKSAFLTWVQAQEGRYEFAGDRVVMMTGGSRGQPFWFAVSPPSQTDKPTASKPHRTAALAETLTGC